MLTVNIIMRLFGETSARNRGLTDKEQYLLSLDGRDLRDVLIDPTGREYVLMWDGVRHDTYRHYLPIFENEVLKDNYKDDAVF